jgi:hypothetical protein
MSAMGALRSGGGANGAPIGWPQLAAALIGLAALAAVCLAMIRLCEGAFNYALDDPYIHLALARSILHGTYGINPGEMSSPSSSILWPFLLAPFAALRESWFELVPLAINSACLVVSLFLLVRLAPARMPGWLAAGVALVLGASLNLIGLAVSGMEHSLQVLLVLVALEAFCVGGEDGARQPPARFYLALALLPMVRYEGFALAAPWLVYELYRGRGRPAVLAGAAAGLAVAAFTAFLWSHGLGILPSSVVAKSSSAGLRPLANFISQVSDFRMAFGVSLLLVALISRRDRALALVVLAATLLHFALGRFGWLGRYEVYWLCFVMVLLVREVGRFSIVAAAIAALLPFGVTNAWMATLQSPAVAQGIHAQNVQMARIMRLSDGAFAVNDLGLTALRGGHPVIDLYGLGSHEALTLRLANPTDSAWVGPLLARHHVPYVMVFDEWFPRLPASLIRVGALTLKVPRIAAGSATVAFYATDPGAAVRLRASLRRYAGCCATAQAGVTVY